jgi:hypothetical protein
MGFITSSSPAPYAGHSAHAAWRECEFIGTASTRREQMLTIFPDMFLAVRTVFRSALEGYLEMFFHFRIIDFCNRANSITDLLPYICRETIQQSKKGAGKKPGCWIAFAPVGSSRSPVNRSLEFVDSLHDRLTKFLEWMPISSNAPY